MMRGVSMSKILIIEDDEDLKEGLEFSLKMDGYYVQSTVTQKEGFRHIQKNDYDGLQPARWKRI